MHVDEQSPLAIERRNEADKPHRSIVIPSGLRTRPNPNAEALAGAAIHQAARELPDAAFGNDPGVQALRAALVAREGVEANRLAIRTWLRSERERLVAKVDAASEVIAWGALFDAAARDGDFAQTRTALTALASDRELVHAIDTALRMLDKQRGLADGVDAARAALRSRIFELKLMHAERAQKGG